MLKMILPSLAALAIGYGAPALACSDDVKKDVRDAWKEYGTGKIEEAAKALKASCGCEPKIKMLCKGFTADGIYQIRNAPGALADIGKNYCSDDASKKEWCTIKDVEIVHGAADKTTCKGGKMTITGTGGSAAVNESDVKACL